MGTIQSTACIVWTCEAALNECIARRAVMHSTPLYGPCQPRRMNASPCTQFLPQYDGHFGGTKIVTIVHEGHFRLTAKLVLRSMVARGCCQQKASNARPGIMNLRDSCHEACGVAATDWLSWQDVWPGTDCLAQATRDSRNALQRGNSLYDGRFDGHSF